MKSSEDRRAICHGLSKVQAECSSYKLRSSLPLHPTLYCYIFLLDLDRYVDNPPSQNHQDPIANHLHLNTAATAHLTERHLLSSCHFLYLSSPPFLPNPNHQFSKQPISSCQVRSFQNQLELFPFLYPLTSGSVFLNRDNSLAQVLLTLIPHPKTNFCHIHTHNMSHQFPIPT